MRIKTLVAVMFAGAITSLATAFDTVPYVLTSESQYLQGCFGRCLCPVMISTSMTGGFDFKDAGVDPLFAHYDLNNVQMVATVDGSEISIVGSGKFTVGGRVALLQRLELDVSLDGAAPEHFDSGWTSPEVYLPAFDAVVSINGMICFDTVLHIVATPASTSPYDLDGDGSVGGSDLAILLGAWGRCSPGNSQCNAADFDDNGKVDAADLSLLLGAWG